MRLASLIILFSLLIPGISRGQATEERAIGSFSSIKVGEGISVYLEKGQKESIRVVTERGGAGRVVTELSGTTLKIHFDGSNSHLRDVKVYVTFVKLNEIYASSAAGIYSKSIIEASDLEISVTSAATVELTIEAGEVEVAVSTSGDLVLEGKAALLEAKVSTAGDIDAYGLAAAHVIINASTAGSARVTATKEIEARAATAGEIRYRGNPDKSYTDASTGGSVRKSD